MSTHGRIAIKCKDGSYLSCYHHSDSYPEHLGKLLIESWNDEKELQNAIALGDSSYWADTIEENRYYGRDYKEPDVEPLVSQTIQDLLEDGTAAWEDYVYVREHNQWSVFIRRKKHDLKTYLQKENV